LREADVRATASLACSHQFTAALPGHLPAMWPPQRLQRRLSYSDKLPKLEGMEPPRRCIREGITSINRGHCDASGHADIADGQTTHRWNRSRSLEPFGVLRDCSITTSRATD